MPVPRHKRKSKMIYGNGIVKLLKKNVKVELDDGDVMLFEYDDVPENLKKEASGHTHNVTISERGDKLIAVRPYSGSLPVKFVGFMSGKDEPPMPRKIEFQAPTPKRNWPIDEHYEFTAKLEVTGGKHIGQQLTLRMWYTFEQYGDSDITSVPEGYKRDKLVMDFLELAGFDFENMSIPWSDNVLPFLEETLLNAKAPDFLVSVEKGWVKAVMEGID